MRAEAGFTLVEVLVAVLVVVIGIGVTVASLALPQEQTLSAGREEQAAAIAIEELEELAGRPWTALGLTVAPQRPAGEPDDADNPADPRFYVEGPRLQVKRNFRDASSGPLPDTPAAGEPLVAIGARGVEPVSRTAAGRPPGTIYRFVTAPTTFCPPDLPLGLNALLDPVAFSLAGDLLPVLTGTGKLGGLLDGGVNLFCGAQGNTRRVTVAVRLDDAANGAGPTKPLYFSTIVPNPDAGLLAGNAPLAVRCEPALVTVADLVCL